MKVPVRAAAAALVTTRGVPEAATASPPTLPVRGGASLRTPARLHELLLYRLGRLFATAGAMTLRVCEGEFGITRRQWRLLALLAEHGTLQPSALALHAELDRARTSRALSTLAAKGLVTRRALASDRRLAQVQLTERGRQLHARAMPRMAAINGALVDGLDDRELAQLDRVLAQLQAHAQRLLTERPWPKADRRRGHRGGE